MKENKKPLISVIVPVYNEESGISSFLDKDLMPVLNRLEKYDTELVLVNDGSSDNSLSILHEYAKKNKKMNVKVVAFSRNFGKEVALSAGIKFSSGEAILTIDSDGQQPPKIIPKFIEKWENGAKVVIGVRDKFTDHGFIQKIGSKFFYKIMHFLGANYMQSGSTDFRLIDREVADNFNGLSEHNRITRGLIDWLGFRQDYIKYTYGKRISGKPSYSIKKLFKLAIDSFVSTSVFPMFIFGFIGSILLIYSLPIIFILFINNLTLSNPLNILNDPVFNIFILLSFFSGLILISNTVSSLYVGQIHDNAKKRPLYVVDKTSSRNLDELNNE